MLSDADRAKAAASKRVHRIGELAEMSGATTRTLRYYEELGLLEPVRNTSGQRLYGDDAMTRLNFINELKAGGFSLNEIQSFFSSWKQAPTGAKASEATMKLIEDKIAEIAQVQKRLAKLNDELRGMVNFLATCRTCEKPPSSDNCNPCERQENEIPEVLAHILRRES